MHECRKCEQFGLSFERNYAPDEFLEGSPQSRIWIVGLNPAIEPNPEVSALQDYFGDSSELHPYFRDFALVLPRLYEGFGNPAGTAHTDLVKCASNRWPPPNVRSSSRKAIILNCEGFLLTQIRRHRPSMIICNGAEVSAALKRALPPSSSTSERDTSYFADIEGHKICVVLSGFIGRMDNYAKRRLGAEIETRLAEMGL